jgi:hypothetical protein
VIARFHQNQNQAYTMSSPLMNRGDFSRKGKGHKGGRVRYEEILPSSAQEVPQEPTSGDAVPAVEDTSGVDAWKYGVPTKRHDITPERMHQPDFYDNVDLGPNNMFDQTSAEPEGAAAPK